MQHESPAGETLAVQVVTDDGCAEAAATGGTIVDVTEGTMYADLMAPPSDRLELHADAGCAVGECFVAEDGVLRAGTAALLWIMDLARTILKIRANGQVNQPFPAHGQAFEGARLSSIEHCDVGFLCKSILKLNGKVAMGLLVQTDREDTGSVHVDSVSGERAARAVDAGGDPCGDTIGLVWVLLAPLTGHTQEA